MAKTIKFSFLGILFLLYGCHSEEKKLYEEILVEYAALNNYSGNNFNELSDKIQSLISKIETFNNPDYSVVRVIETQGYLQELKKKQLDLENQISLFKRIMDRQKEKPRLSDLKAELRDISEFLNKYPESIARETLTKRASVLENIVEDVLNEEMKSKLPELYSLMDQAAEQVAKTRHPMSNITNFSNINDSQPLFNGEGSYQIIRDYRVNMSGMMYGHFTMLIRVVGDMTGNTSSGASFSIQSSGIVSEN